MNRRILAATVKRNPKGWFPYHPAVTVTLVCRDIKEKNGVHVFVSSYLDNR